MSIRGSIDLLARIQIYKYVQISQISVQLCHLLVSKRLGNLDVSVKPPVLLVLLFWDF